MAFLRDPCNQDHRSTLSFLRKSHIFYSLPQAFYVGPVEEVSTWPSIIIKYLLVEKRKILHSTKHSSPLFVALACNLPILERFDQIFSHYPLSSKQRSWSISAFFWKFWESHPGQLGPPNSLLYAIKIYHHYVILTNTAIYLSLILVSYVSPFCTCSCRVNQNWPKVFSNGWCWQFEY